MELFFILLLLIGGLVLIVLELVAIPGTTIAGLGGVGLIAYGLVRVYSEYGNMWGTIALLICVIITVILLIYSLRAKTWKRFTLNESIESKVNVIEEEAFKVGDRGISITRLASGGIAEFDGHRIEVYSITSYVDPQTEVEIDRIENRRVYVRPIKDNEK